MRKNTLVLVLCFVLIFFCITSTSCEFITDYNEQSLADEDKNQSQKSTESDKENDTEDTKKKDDYLYILKDKESKYRLAYSNNCLEKEKSAAKEFIYFFEQGTGLTIDEVIVDSNTILEGNEKYIVIGRDLALVNDVKNEEMNKDSGYTHYVKGDNLYIFGNTDTGTLNGVYGFFRRFFNLTIYYTDVFDIDKIDGLTIPCDKYTFNPSITYGLAGYGELSNYYSKDSNEAEKYRNRMGFYLSEELFVSSIHNFLSIISPAKYMKAHPDWFVTISNDYGTATSLNLSYNNFEMVSTVAEEFEKILEENDDLNILGFSQPDFNAWSKSESSANLYEKYGVYSAEYVLFMNKLCALLQVWLRKNYPDRVVRMYMLAYDQTFDAPVKINDLGEYEPLDSSLMLYKNKNIQLDVYIAPVSENMYKALDDDINSKYSEEIKKWSALGNDDYLWIYSLYSNALMPLSTVSALSETYKFASENNIELIFNQSYFNSAVSTDWSRLKIYLQSELIRNTDFDVDVGIQNFFKAYFKEASESMLRLFNEEEDWYDVIYSRRSLVDEGYSRIGYLHNAGYLYWRALWDDDIEFTGLGTTGADDSMFIRWMTYIDDAYNSIEKYRLQNPELYEELYERIELESLPIRYMYVLLYPNEAKETMEDIYSSCVSLGMTQINENVSLYDKEEALEIMKKGGK